MTRDAGGGQCSARPRPRTQSGDGLQPSRDTPQPDVGVVLHSLRDRAICLAEGALRRGPLLRERVAEGAHEEGVRLAVEGERAGLAAGADDAAGAGREAAQVLALAARGAGPEL